MSDDNQASPPEREGESRFPEDYLNAVRRYFIAGLLVVVPIWGTYLALRTLFKTLDGVLGNLLKGSGIYYLPGFGILVLISLILLAGLFATNIFGKKFLQMWDDFLHRVPVVRNVYSLVKSIVETLSVQQKERGRFHRVVLVEYPRKGAYSIGFVTGEVRAEIQRLPFERLVNIFIPMTPTPFTGFLIHLPESEVIPTSLSVEEAMKMIVAAGIYAPVSISDLAEAARSSAKEELR
ncbi:DUF502 domain-containing protein [Candidatus Manganitrophus noduliformans]|uniref:DUF502 domain-containing protein n=1 Tax=Candidatus Manganitrophus noduliformans TaxID=2606439 RepID=A0A7X6DR07_9BACT|nr:DUF502 domain-containing protein [Candidatus Manganitrophus noduliformans]NKE71791.1 DUF502 domain-containing protein [Candidatus Manganitrophus noduliformans]